MSFLLRKSQAKPHGARLPPGGGGGTNRNVMSRSRSSTTKQHARGGQMQQLLQRRPAQQKQSSKQKTTKETAAQEQQLQGVISMDEVMEDLRVLEQQQRDSQRKLATAKLAKQHKLEQRASLESKLSSLKYANGEQREQLNQARVVLSRSTRELGSAKLLSDRSRKALKDFSDKLNRALSSARSLQALRRKLDSAVIEISNMHSIILRKKSEAIESLKGTEKRRDEAKHHEQSLRQSIHAEKLKAQRLMEDTANIRADISGLEEDLPTAQQMAVSTKLRAESILSEIEAEDKRHASKMQAMAAKLAEVRKQKAERIARRKILEEQIELKKAQLHGSWEHCVRIQQEEGHDVSPEPSEGGPPPSIDVDRIEAELEVEREALRVETAKRDAMTEKVAENHEKLASILSKDKAAKEEAESIRKAAEAALEVESDRKEANEKFLEELERERTEVSELRRSVKELEDSKEQEKNHLTDKITAQAKAIEGRQLELMQSKAALAAAGSNIQELENAFEKEKAEHAKLVANTKKEADLAREAFENARHKVEKLGKEAASDIQKEVKEVEQAQNILVEDTRDAIEELYEKYPRLREVIFVYDPDKTADEQKEEALANLRADCDALIAQVRDQKKKADRKKAAAEETARAERKASKECQEQEADAFRERKEERRREKQRRQAERQKASSRDTVAGDEGIIQSSLRASEKDGSRSDRTSKEDTVQGADVDIMDAESQPLAASQRRIRWEGLDDDDDAPEDKINASVPASSQKDLSSNVHGLEKKSHVKSRSRTYGRRESSSACKSKPKRTKVEQLDSGVSPKSSRYIPEDREADKARARSLRENSTSKTERAVSDRSKKPDSAKARMPKGSTSRPSSKPPEDRSAKVSSPSTASKRKLEDKTDADVASKRRISTKSSVSAKQDVSRKVSHRSVEKKSQSSSRPATKHSSRKDDSRSVASHNKRRRSPSAHTGASQASGISTLERAPAPKSRRRKKNGPTTSSKSKSSTDFKDYDFHF